MKVVHKYEIQIEDYPSVEMPAGAELLHFGTQADPDRVFLWARVDTQAQPWVRRFRLAGTGHPNPEGVYVGTALLHGGRFVLHLFDLGD